MSQFYVQSTGGSGPLPPDVPTMFTVDLNAGGAPFGTVTPENNNVFVFGNPVAADTQGIVTQALTTTAPNDTIFLRYITGTTNSIGGPSRIIKTVPIPIASAFTIMSVISAFDSLTGDNFGGRLLAIGTNIAGSVAVTSVIENTSGGTGALVDCHITIVAQANAVAVQVTGVAGETISWQALIPVLSIASL